MSHLWSIFDPLDAVNPQPGEQLAITRATPRRAQFRHDGVCCFATDLTKLGMDDPNHDRDIPNSNEHDRVGAAADLL